MVSSANAMHNSSLSRTVVISAIWFASFLVPNIVLGQTGISSVGSLNPSMLPAAYYYTAKPGEITITVNLWGQILRPGRYEVISTTDLVQLISFAGGPQQYANMDEVRVMRFDKVDGRDTVCEFIVDMEKLKSPHPFLLKPGDTVIIKSSAWPAIRDAFSVVTTAAIISSAIAQIIYASRR